MHRDGENVSDISADDFVSQLRVLVRVVGHHLHDLAAKRRALRDGDVVHALSHHRVVVVAIENCDLKEKEKFRFVLTMFKQI